MKLDIKDDFTSLPRCERVLRAVAAGHEKPHDFALLAHDERHLRRRVLVLSEGGRVLVDLAEPTTLDHGDLLLLEDGRSVEIRAAEEEVYSIKARSQLHLAELCWHIGNRHLAAQIEPDRIVILRDHVIRDMLEGLGAEVAETEEQFRPVRGAYSGHGHHGHHHGEPDRFGRMPGDPHYGHNHA
ncbi:MAG: urease accessory protein UreE [Rhizobiaceae bacterium]|nr:urease accessory protein UreE [Rhizobiaceae bacterium]